jgi:hypothetical protein
MHEQAVRDAFNKIVALRKLTADTGVKTYKSQSAILESLPHQVLACVAILLTKEEKETVNATELTAK